MLQEKEPCVSIIIPTKNRSEFLKRAMYSVAIQNFKSMEVCIVDNNTNDRLSEDVCQLVEMFNNIYNTIKWLYVKSKHLFASGARNDGIRNTTGKYICFLDDDDELLPHSINKRVKLLESAPELALVYCGGYTKIYSYPFKLYRYHSFHKSQKRLDMMLCAMLISRSVVEKYQLYFDERLRRTEDYDLGKRILESNLKIASIPDALIKVHLHASPRMSTNSLEECDFKDILLEKWGIDADNEMYGYAPAVFIWRKCFKIEKRTYREVADILKLRFNYNANIVFTLKFYLAAISPKLYFITYHLISAGFQFGKNNGLVGNSSIKEQQGSDSPQPLSESRSSSQTFRR